MFTLYCQKCGSKNQNPVSKPNFCQSCGEPFNNNTRASATIKEKVAIFASTTKNTEDDDYEGDINGEQGSDSPHINPDDIKDFPVEIVVSKPTSQKISSLVGTNASAPKPIPTIKVKRNHNKEIMNLYRQEAGTLRGPKKKNG